MNTMRSCSLPRHVNVFRGHGVFRNGKTFTRDHRRVEYPRDGFLFHPKDGNLLYTRHSSVSTRALADVMSTSPLLSDMAATATTFVAGVLAVSSIKWLENNGLLHKVCLCRRCMYCSKRYNFMCCLLGFRR